MIPQTATRNDGRPVLLAVAIAHQARVAAERAATARDVSRAHPARRAAEALAGALVGLERLLLPDRAAWLAEHSRDTPLAMPGTATPAERAWLLGWHLIAATGRLHRRASAGGRQTFGEQETAQSLRLVGRALRELNPLLSSERRRELRTALGPAALALDAQLRLFAPVIDRRRAGSDQRPAPEPR